MVVALGLLDGGPQRGGAVSEAGSLVLPVEFACGVGGRKATSQGARRAARPWRVPLWDEALVGGTEVHIPCGSTLEGGRIPAYGRTLGLGVACGEDRTVALQKTRRASEPRRASLWGNAGQVVRVGVTEEALEAAPKCASMPCCANGISNLALMLSRSP